MSQAQHERGEFISSRMRDYILKALGHGEIDATEASRIFDLTKKPILETSGSTHNDELAKEPFYVQAVKDWGKVKERRRMKYESKVA